MIDIFDKNSLSPRAIQHRFMCINRLHRKAVDAKISAAGIHRSQHMILMYLYKNKDAGKISQKDIAKHFEISAAAVTVSLKKLESDGYIKRKASENDNRFNEIEITERGKKMVDYSHASFYAIDEKSFEGITEDEKALLASLLDKVMMNLKELSAKEENL